MSILPIVNLPTRVLLLVRRGKIWTSFSNSGNLLKVQYTGLVGLGSQLAMNCAKHSQQGFIIIFHLLSRQMHSRDCMKVNETHTKVLARKISDVSMQQF